MKRSFVRAHRGKVVAALLLVAAVGGVILAWKPLVAWFGTAPASHTHAPEKSEPDRTAEGAGSRGLELLSYSFEGAARERMVAAFQGYEQVRVLLVHDTLRDLDAQAAAIRAALEGAQEGLAGAPPETVRAVEDARASAEALGRAEEIGEARRAFGDLSELLVALGASDPALAEEYRVFECPMTDGYGKWFQRGERLENPYMGQAMPACGSPSEWKEAALPVSEEHAHADGDGEIAYYTCPMHPSVKRAEPGQCPICNMDLTPVTQEEVRTGTILVDEARRQRIGVRTAPAGRREMKLSLRSVGEVRYDESRLTEVNLRMSGWVERLLVDETGQRVRKGQVLFHLYSPELYAAQLEHLSTARRVGEGTGETFERLARSSRQRLRLLGMTDAQIARLEESGEARETTPILSPASGFILEKNVVVGANVTAGQLVYRIADLSRIWIDAEVFESDLPHVRLKQPVRVELPYVPDRVFEGRVDHIYPTLSRATRTGRVRVILDNPDLALKPEMYADVRFEVDLGERLAIPESAVLYTGPRRLVFLDLGSGRLRPQEVELGVHAGGYYEVTSGLEEGDVIVTSGNFLIAAESRIRAAEAFWEGAHEHH